MEINNNQFLTKGTKEGQMALLFITCVLFVVFVLFLLIDFTITMFILVLVEIIFTIVVNSLFKNYYDLRIENEYLIFENVWNKKKMKRSDLLKIKPHSFLFPYNLNPFIDLHFRSTKEVLTTKINKPQRTYLTNGGLKTYIDNLLYFITKE